MRSSNYYIVKKPFAHGMELLCKGSPVDTTNWIETDTLLELGYLRVPRTIEDWELIQESARGIKRDPYEVND
jgi:hypothetical protein